MNGGTRALPSSASSSHHGFMKRRPPAMKDPDTSPFFDNFDVDALTVFGAHLGDVIRSVQDADRTTSDLAQSKEQLAELEAELRRVREGAEVLENRKDQISRISKALNTQRDMKNLFRAVVHLTSELVGADRSTLFLVDREKHQLWSRVAEDAEVIRVPLDTGIVGAVACSGKPITIGDAYTDARFNRAVDRQSGYRTRSILTVPVFSHVGGDPGDPAARADAEVIGVLQCINKTRGHDAATQVFTAEDRDFLMEVAGQIAVAIETTQHHETAGAEAMNSLRDMEQGMQMLKHRVELQGKSSTDRSVMMLNISQRLGKQRKLDNVFLSVMNETCQLISAERATLFLVDTDRDELWSRVAGNSEPIRVSLRSGLAGYAARHREIVNVDSPYQVRLLGPLWSFLHLVELCRTIQIWGLRGCCGPVCSSLVLSFSPSLPPLSKCISMVPHTLNLNLYLYPNLSLYLYLSHPPLSP